MRGDYLAMRNTVPAQELPGQCRVFGGDTQSSPLLGGIITGQVPEISAGAHIDPGFGYSHNETAMAIAQIAL